MKHNTIGRLLRIAFTLILLSLGVPQIVGAAGSQSGSGSFGLQGTIPSPPPSTGATITSPPNGGSTSNELVTVTGTCASGTLVEVYDNGVFVGSVQCNGTTFSLQISLFGGTNTITAKDYDALDQSGPVTNIVSYTYNTPSFGGLGSTLQITTPYAKRGANPGDTLTWPIVISGGTAPYTVIVDWGDGQSPQPYTQTTSGTLNISHVYKSAGVYTVTIKVTDQNGQTSFLQLVGIANGVVSAQSTTTVNNSTTPPKTVIIWWPLAVAIPFIIITFWLGRRYQIGALRRLLEREGR